MTEYLDTQSQKYFRFFSYINYLDVRIVFTEMEFSIHGIAFNKDVKNISSQLNASCASNLKIYYLTTFKIHQQNILLNNV